MKLVMKYQLEWTNVCVNVSLKQTYRIIPSTIQRETSPGVTSGNFRHYAISVCCFIESLSRQRSVREVTIEREKHIPHCVFLSESQTTAWVAVRPRAKLFDDKSIFVLWNAADSIHPRCFPCFPIRRFDFSPVSLSLFFFARKVSLLETGGICERAAPGEGWLLSVFLSPYSNFPQFVPCREDGSFPGTIYF